MLQLQIGGSFGRIASGMCIARFLAAVVSPRATAITRQDRRQRALFDYSLCIGVPFIGMACHIIYQPIRFILATGRGCAVATSMTWPTLVLWTIWPPIFAVIGVLYSGVYWCESSFGLLTIQSQPTPFTVSSSTVTTLDVSSPERIQP